MKAAKKMVSWMLLWSLCMGLTFFSVMAQEREKKLTNEEERVISLEETVLISFPEEPAPQTVSSFVFSHTEAETLPTQASGIEIIDTLEINDQIVSLVQSNIGETQEELIARLQNSYPNAEIQPNYRYEVFSSFANDPEYHKLRALKNIGWERALQALSTQSLLQPPLIAVIDLGIDYRHPDLKNQMRDGEKCLDKNGNFWGNCKHGASFILSGVYFSGTNPVGTRLEDKDPLPATMVPDPYNSWALIDVRNQNTHGTHIAGIIAAELNNHIWIVGVHPYAKLMAIKAGYQVGVYSFMYTSVLAQALDFARHNGGNIVNVSLGLEGKRDPKLTEAITNFTENGGIFVTAAGNKWNDANNTFPCNLSRTNPRVICVGASNQDNTFSYFSNYNPDIVNIAAPGVAIYSTIQENSYEYQQGTSMATPMVAASLGVLKSYRPDLNPEEIITALYQGADQLSNLDAKVKSGRKLNLYESMKTIDKVPPQVTGTGDTQQWCSSGLINYTISAKDDLVDTGILYSFDQGKSWSSTDSIITGTSSLSGLVKDRKGNETQLSIFPVIPVCLSGSLMLEKTAVKNEMITLKISTTTGFFYEISGDIAEIKTGFFNTGEDISVALSVGTGEKKLSWIAFLSGHKSIVGSGKVMVDKTSPQIIIKNPHSNVTTTDTEILLAGQVFDNHRIKKLVINGVNIAVEWNNWEKRISLHQGNNSIRIEAVDEAGNLIGKNLSITRNAIVSASWGWWGGWGWWWWAASSHSVRLPTKQIISPPSPLSPSQKESPIHRNFAASLAYHAQLKGVSSSALEQKILSLEPLIQHIFSMPKYAGLAKRKFVKSLFMQAQSSSKKPLIQAASAVLLEHWKW